ncbi:MAG: cytidylate kinase-like family protein [Clostridia bacterium]|nr:cytidylate kinase-like family protein [Clostridia bacterium]
MSLVVTIGRQYGSAGKDVGKIVAEELGIPFYNKELVDMAANKGNISTEAVREIDEKATSSFLYSLVNGNYTMSGAPMHYEMPVNDKLFIAQSEVIKELAKQGSCVIVGRCADYVLRDVEGVDVCSVFVYGSLDYRVKRVMEAYPELSPSKAREKVIKTDKQRRTYYDYYSDGDWGIMENYDICLNTETLGIEKAAMMLVDYLKNR